jgi:threonine dehydrogenase-like Zn-dependent dehydrogenase
VFVGLVPGDVTFDDPEFHRRELTLLASRNARPTDFTRVLALIESGRVDTSPWITHRAKLRDVPAHFAGWAKPENSVLKAMIDVSD